MWSSTSPTTSARSPRCAHCSSPPAGWCCWSPRSRGSTARSTRPWGTCGATRRASCERNMTGSASASHIWSTSTSSASRAGGSRGGSCGAGSSRPVRWGYTTRSSRYSGWSASCRGAWVSPSSPSGNGRDPTARAHVVGDRSGLQRGPDHRDRGAPPARRPASCGDPRGGRCVDRSNGRGAGPSGARGARPSGDPSSDEPWQRSGAAQRLRRRHRRCRRGTGRRSRIRPRGALETAGAYPPGSRRRGLWVSLPRRPAPRPLLLACDRQPAAHAALQHAHEPELERHGDVLQAGARRPLEAAATERRAVRDRGRADGAARASGCPHLGAADFLHRSHLPGTPAAVHYPPLYPLVLAPLFRVFSVPTAAYLGKVLNVLLAALGTGLIAWHAARNRLVGEELPVWLAPAVVAGTAIAIPVLATQAVLFFEPVFCVLLSAAVVLGDAPPPRLPAVPAGCVPRVGGRGGRAPGVLLLVRGRALGSRGLWRLPPVAPLECRLDARVLFPAPARLAVPIRPVSVGCAPVARARVGGRRGGLVAPRPPAPPPARARHGDGHRVWRDRGARLRGALVGQHRAPHLGQLRRAAPLARHPAAADHPRDRRRSARLVVHRAHERSPVCVRLPRSDRDATHTCRAPRLPRAPGRHPRRAHRVRVRVRRRVARAAGRIPPLAHRRSCLARPSGGVPGAP